MSNLRADWAHRPTHRRIWALAAPMIVSNVTVPLVTLTDSIVAGHLPHASQLAAVAVGGAIYQLPVFLCGFLRMGTVGFSAQACGRGDGDAMRRILLQALLLSLALAAIQLLAAVPLLQPILRMMDPTADLGGLGAAYLHVRLAGLPAALASYALAGWFLGAQNARVTVQILILTNLANIALNLLFVLGFGWGVRGIALASVIGEWGGCLFGLSRIASQLRRFPGHLHPRRLLYWAHWRPLLGVNRDILLRSVALEGVFFALTTLGARLGGPIVAANALLLNGLLLTSFALDGLANAVESVAGHAIGARQGDTLRRAMVVAGGWSLGGSLLFAATFALGGHLFVDLQTDIAAVRQVAYVYLPYLALLPMIAFPSYLFDGLFVGATRAREMRNAMVVAALAFVVAALLLRPLGNHGLWVALLVFMGVRGGAMAWTARRIARSPHGWLGQPSSA
ncbi:MATE family efflux transporter [Oleiagrimonas soli]|uniref:MATE family multidrug resistance protein n=1 Tax=Oleiagrimonas soli TaxID=1543381 RepID=A0A099CXI0_9GAMM|nr:MATE family efflux transporter [Oleiagrimonas soli]KGI78327.1 XRE family transcriptional regulator [Oleiagrimonas soli]MBB6183178.1 MATE family multidrug resistance protein [Oleiagrimonas soli]